jgi:hypothetical protein
MVALIEFTVVGIVFLLMIFLSNSEKITDRRKKSIIQRLKIIGQYWKFYLISFGLIVLAFNIAYPIKAWKIEIQALLLSAVMMFIGFFIFTATFLRMKNKIAS